VTRAVGAVGRQGHQRLAVFYHHGGYTTPRRKACRPRPGPIHATRHLMTLKASKCVRGTEGLLCVQRWRWSRGCSTTRQEVEQRWRWSRGGGAEADAGSGAAEALCVARLLVTAQLARHLTSDGPLGSRSTSRIVSVSYPLRMPCSSEAVLLSWILPLPYAYACAPGCTLRWINPTPVPPYALNP
jgi:hypothetical protein